MSENLEENVEVTDRSQRHAEGLQAAVSTVRARNETRKGKE